MSPCPRIVFGGFNSAISSLAQWLQRKASDYKNEPVILETYIPERL